MGTSMNTFFHNTTSRYITTISPVGVRTPQDMSVCAPFSLHDIFSSSLEAVKRYHRATHQHYCITPPGPEKPKQNRGIKRK